MSLSSLLTTQPRLDPVLLVVQLLGGLALFLFGMQVSSESLQRGGAGRLHGLFLRLGPLKGTALGIGTTFLTQSSSATSVILVSMVNASLLTMAQTIPILLGAGVGTAFTVQLIAFRFFDYALVLVAAGVLVRLVARREGWRTAADIILGFGLIFYGMLVMAQALAPLRESREIAGLLFFFRESPWLALLLATLVTAIIQASGAVIGILISFSLQYTGPDLLTMALPLVLGANLGTCITAFLGALGGRREGYRVALVQFLMKLAGALLAMGAGRPLVRATIALTGSDPARQIANLHTFFNLGLVLIFLPLRRQAAALTGRLLPLREEERPFALKYLGRTCPGDPDAALQAVRQELLRHAGIIRMQLERVEPLFSGYSAALLRQTVAEDEKSDFLQRGIADHLHRLLLEALPRESARQAERCFLIASDLESMGDVVVKNIVPLAEKRNKKRVRFSPQGQEELSGLFRGLVALFDGFTGALAVDDPRSMENCFQAARRFRKKCDTLRLAHLRRLVEGRRSSVETSSIHLDLLENMRRLDSQIKGMCRYYLQEERS